MKKLRIVAALLLVASTVLFVGFKFVEKFRYDNQPPEITFMEEALDVSVTASEEELLQGVTAQDKKDGDVTESLVVESMSAFTGEDTRVITYAASDRHGNVGRAERKLHYTDYRETRFHFDMPLRFPTGKLKDVLPYITAESVIDGDITDKVKYALPDRVNINSLGKYPIEFSVMDSAGNTVCLPTVLEIYDEQMEQIHVELKDYLIYIKQGESFQPETYYQGADQEGTLSLVSDVDVNEPGVYHVDYIVKNENSIGRSRLIVVVEE